MLGERVEEGEPLVLVTEQATAGTDTVEVAAAVEAEVPTEFQQETVETAGTDMSKFLQ